MVLETFNEHDWTQNFRMRKATFLYLCDQVRPIIQREDTHLRKAICVEKRVAITLWCLATPSEYRTIGHLFGVARCTVCVIVHETVDAIVSKLLTTYITFPTGQALVKVVQGFDEKWNLPQCAGAIDGSHIPVKAPLLNHTDYYNRKGWYSVIIQAVVDCNYLFRDVYVGWPGSVHDARVFANSTLYQKATDKLVLQGNARELNGKTVPIYLAGDSGYPLLPWLIKPFCHNSALTAKQKHFNYRLSRARIVVENAFGRLKARWRRLMKQNDMVVHNVPKVIAACCILHNVCEVHGEVFDEEWLEEAQCSVLHNPATIVQEETDDADAQDIRNALMEYLHLHPL